MIAFLRGTVQELGAGYLVLAVGGVGYRVEVPPAVLAATGSPGSELQVYTHLHRREDALALYGFLTAEERGLFQQLLEVSGVGPRAALAVLAALSPANLRQAIAREDLDVLTRVPGIGRKTAQRLVMELREKLGTGTASRAEKAKRGRTVGAPLPDPFSEALEALVSLGYSRQEAGQALERVGPGGADGPETEDLVRQSLKLLGGAGGPVRGGG